MIECKACFSTEFRYLEPLGNFYQGQCRHCGKVNRFDREEVEGDNPDTWESDNDGRFATDEDAVNSPDDSYDDGYALASAGFGTDEDYNHYCYGDD